MSDHFELLGDWVNARERAAIQAIRVLLNGEEITLGQLAVVLSEHPEGGYMIGDTHFPPGHADELGIAVAVYILGSLEMDEAMARLDALHARLFPPPARVLH